MTIVEVITQQPLTAVEINSFKGMPVGGEAGQVLSKATGNDFDIEWIDVAGVAAPAWVDITGKPTTFPPSSHNHSIAEVTNLQTTLDGKQPLNSVLTNTTASFTSVLETKLNSVAVGAEVNVNADWNSVSGDSQILNKPTTFTPSAHSHAISDVTGLQAELDSKQAALVSGTNIKTINGTTLLGSGDITISGGGSANLSLANNTATALDILSDTGTDVTLPQATTSLAGLFSASDKTKLNGIASGATVNSSDATLLSRTNHTGTQTASTISDFSTAVDGRISSSVGVSVQAFDADLTAIAALSTNGLARRTGVGTWSIDTNSYLTANQTITFSGDATGSGTTAVTLTIPNDNISNAKLANMAANTLKGNNTGVSADPVDLTVAQVKALLAYTAADVGAAATSHTHTLSNISDVTMTVANLNALDDGVNTALHFHDADRNRANHTGTQTASTISDFNTAADARVVAGITGKQPLDGDLTSLAAASGTNTIYYRSAADTWSPVTIGTNLTFSGGNLSATGGGGGSGIDASEFYARQTHFFYGDHL